MKKIIFILLIVQMCSTACFSQINYGFKVYSGISDLRKIQKDPYQRYSPYFKALPLYGAEIFTGQNLRNSRYSFEQSIALESVAAEYNWADYVIDFMQEDFPDSTFITSWENRHYLISIPLKIKYQFEPWLCIIAGLDNVFYVSKKDHHINQLYALRGRLGFEVTINNKFLIGINSTTDITPSGIFVPYESIYFKYYTASLSLGIVLGKN